MARTTIVDRDANPVVEDGTGPALVITLALLVVGAVVLGILFATGAINGNSSSSPGGSTGTSNSETGGSTGTTGDNATSPTEEPAPSSSP